MAALVAVSLAGTATACGDIAAPTPASDTRLKVTRHANTTEFDDPYELPGVIIDGCGDGYPSCGDSDPWGPCGPAGCNDDPCSIDPYSSGCSNDPAYQDPPQDPPDQDPGTGATSPPPPAADDKTDKPDCSKPQTSDVDKGYCRSKDPDPTQKARITDALNKMKAIGGVCATLADLGFHLLAATPSRIRVVTLLSTDSFSGAAPLGGALPANGGPDGPDAYIMTSTSWTDQMYDASHHTTVTSTEKYQRDLQNDLAHELDHLEGHDHIDNDVWNTQNSRACSGLP